MSTKLIILFILKVYLRMADINIMLNPVFFVNTSQRVGFLSLALGMLISCVFGFCFGLILGTTEMPWGQNADWPTEEMRGR